MTLFKKIHQSYINHKNKKILKKYKIMYDILYKNKITISENKNILIKLMSEYDKAVYQFFTDTNILPDYKLLTETLTLIYISYDGDYLKISENILKFNETFTDKEENFTTWMDKKMKTITFPDSEMLITLISLSYLKYLKYSKD